MRPSSARIVACPHCDAWLRCQVIEFDQRQGADVWSDMRVEHDFWLTPCEIVACPACNAPFRRSGAFTVGELPSSFDELDFRMAGEGWRFLPRFGKAKELAQLERYLAAPTIECLSPAQIAATLADKSRLTPADEIDLRTQQWRNHNDLRRNEVTPAWQSVVSEFERNILRLITLMPRHDALSNLLLAEIHRELGDFHIAMQQLSLVQGQFGHEKAAMMGWIVEGSTEPQQFH